MLVCTSSSSTDKIWNERVRLEYDLSETRNELDEHYNALLMFSFLPWDYIINMSQIEHFMTKF